MKTLLYCVLGDIRPGRLELAGVGGAPVAFVGAARLVAAASQVQAVEQIPSVARIIEYEKVVEVLFNRFTLVPMRYGAIFDGMPAVAQYLEEHHQQLELLLGCLDGCVEMGIRLTGPVQGPNHPVGPPASVPLQMGHGAGRAYLDAQRRHLEAKDGLMRAQREEVERYVRAFEGMVVKYKIEPPDSAMSFQRLLSSVGGELGSSARGAGSIPSASLHFLIKREAVAEFRRRFDGIRVDSSTPATVSGPWPPYNFVVS